MAEHRQYADWYVYIAACPSDPGILKIGFSHDPVRRVRYQRCPDGSRPVLVRTIKLKGRSFWTEQRAHKNLAEFRVKNEWFRISEQNALWAIMRGDRDINPRWSSTRTQKSVGPLEILCDPRPVGARYSLARQYDVPDIRKRRASQRTGRAVFGPPFLLVQAEFRRPRANPGSHPGALDEAGTCQIRSR